MIKLNEVTWYSKLLAAIFLFGIFPVLTFYIGIRYEQTQQKIDEATVSRNEALAPESNFPEFNVKDDIVSPDNSLEANRSFGSELVYMSSSTTRVGEYEVIISCHDLNPTSIEVVKEGKSQQTFSVRGSTPGVQTCLEAQSEDINFDGHQDFLVLTNTGSGGGVMSYWLYDPVSLKFFCPETTDGCQITNPKIDPVTQTITSVSSMGIGNVITKVYKVNDGKLELYQHTESGR